MSNMDRRNLSIMGHLEELRKVLAISIITVIITTSIAYFAFSDKLFNLITAPLKGFDVELVYIGLAEAFVAKIYVAILAGVILALPVLFWQLWSFVSPALFLNERRYLLVIVPFSLLLFALGAAFAYFMVFNFAVRFLLVVVNDEIRPMLSIKLYLSFLLVFLLSFGVAFQIPLVILFLTKIGLIDYHWLVKNRKFALLVIFIAAAILTPPDVISQLILAGPMLLLYEIGVIIARITKSK